MTKEKIKSVKPVVRTKKVSKKTEEKSIAKDIVTSNNIGEVNIRLEWIVILLLLIGIVFSLVTQGFTQPLIVTKANTNKLIEKINSSFFAGESVAKSASFDRKTGYYNVDLESGGQTALIYVTADKKYIMTSDALIEFPEPTEQTATQPKEIQKTDIPTMYLFTMSYCPFGNIADEFSAPVYKLLKDKINFEPHYVIYSKYAAQQGATWSDYCSSEDEKYCSMHGTQELNQNVRELCIWKYDKEKYWDFVLDVNESCTYQNVDQCWSEVAKKYGIDVDKISTCQSEESETLLAKEVELNTQFNVLGSPHLVINDVEYEGDRNPEALKQKLCTAFNSAPEECNTVLDTDAATTSGSCN